MQQLSIFCMVVGVLNVLFGAFTHNPVQILIGIAVTGIGIVGD